MQAFHMQHRAVHKFTCISSKKRSGPMSCVLFEEFNMRVSLICTGHPPVGELKKVGKSRIFWQKVGGFFTKVGKGRIIFSLF